MSTRITRVCANTRQIRPYAWMSLIPLPYQTFKPIVSPQVSFFISFVQTLSLYVQSFILCCTSHSYYYFSNRKKRMSAAKNARTRVRECSLFFASLVAGQNCILTTTSFLYKETITNYVSQNAEYTGTLQNLTSFPGSPRARTASDGKLGGAWERGYVEPTSMYTHFSYVTIVYQNTVRV